MSRKLKSVAPAKLKPSSVGKQPTAQRATKLLEAAGTKRGTGHSATNENVRASFRRPSK